MQALAPLASTSSVGILRQTVLNVLDYGAVGDGITANDGAITATQTALTSAAGTFSATDVGKIIRVAGAGTAGADLYTTIAAYVSATHVTLTAAAGTTVTGATVNWGTDNSTPFNVAVTAATANVNGVPMRLDFPSGNIFCTSGPIQIPPGLAYPLILAGYGAVVLLFSKAISPTPYFTRFNKTADFQTFQNLTVQGFYFDALNVPGQYHVIVGTQSWTRISLAHILVQDCVTANVYTSPTIGQGRFNIWLNPSVNRFDTQCSVTDIKVRRCRMVGGNVGVNVTATCSATGQQQTFTVPSNVSSGTYTVTYGGQTTSAIAYTATAATVQSALQALSSIGAGNVVVTGGAGPGTTYTLIFTDVLTASLANQNVGTVSINSTNLVGGTIAATATIVLATVPPGSQQTITIPAAVTSGSFAVSFNGQTVNGNASTIPAATLQANLEGLSSIGSGNVYVTSATSGGTTIYTLYFVGTMAGQAIPAVTVDSTNGGSGGLVGGVAKTALLFTGADYANCVVDDIEIADCYHTCGSVQVTAGGYANYQIGSRAIGGSCKILRCYGQYSGDVGIEIDSMQYALLEDCIMDDFTMIGFYQDNSFAPVANPNGQVIEYKNCHARRYQSSVVHSYGSGATAFSRPVGFYLDAANTFTEVAEFKLTDCGYYRNASDVQIYGEALTIAGGKIAKVSGFNSVIEGIDWHGTGDFAQSSIAILLAVPTQRRLVILDRVSCTMRGDLTGATGGTVHYTQIWQVQVDNIAAQTTVSTPTLTLVVNDLVTDYNVAGTPPSGCRIFKFGGSPYSQFAFVLSATIRGHQVRSFSGDTGPVLIALATSTLLGLSRVLYTDADIHALPAFTSTNPFLVAGGGGVSPLGKIITRGVLWPVYPRLPTAITPGASPYAYQNLDGYDERVVVSGGTVSDISLSVDGITYVSTGLTAGVFMTVPGEYLQVTYSVAPTMTKIAVR